MTTPNFSRSAHLLREAWQTFCTAVYIALFIEIPDWYGLQRIRFSAWWDEWGYWLWVISLRFMAYVSVILLALGLAWLIYILK